LLDNDAMVSDAEAFLNGDAGDTAGGSGSAKGPVATESEAQEILEEALGESQSDEEDAGEDSPETNQKPELDQSEEPENQDEDEEDAVEEPEEKSEGAEGGPKKGESQRARLRRERAEAQEKAKTLESQLKESETNFSELQDHAEYFAGRFRDTQAELQAARDEVAHLQNRLREFDLPEYGSKAEQELAQMRREFNSLKSQQQAQRAQEEARVRAQKQAQAVQIANEIGSAAKDFGVPPRDVFEAFMISRKTGSGMTPAQAAKKVATLSGAKARRQAAESQASINQSAPKSPKLKGKTGRTDGDPYAYSDDLEGPLRFLNAINGD
jgi:hypothetical protein